MRCRAPGTGLILERSGEGRCESGLFSLTFCQIVALMFPHRDVVAGRLDELLVAMVSPPLVELM
ncbi:MAG: hypothetical protein Nkreftii_000068 [Candidatus Nitrospira kreftii]|uniref:Uncharacterized protein n=1 Tax=Candidatus Nitrospira kreftii TaxID=2652173 RepID=A0A7S8IXQ6_9BACT|nr:MAG: hypothetical protein Nkreftii_000068 [Candidatus Nitrospira kreftii]